MAPKILHPWDLTEFEALRLQSEMAAAVVKEDAVDEINLVAGVDVAYDKHSTRLVAVVVILNAKTLQVVETSITKDYATFPYIPGLFSFRELPPLITSFSKLSHSPDLVVCDGHGYAHPRRFGLACHLGVLFDVPTIGCGKTLLLGTNHSLDKTRGSTSSLIDKGEIIGNVLRTQTNTKPVYVSLGHRISLESACEWILKLSPRYRLPETTRQADQAVRKLFKDLISKYGFFFHLASA